MRRISPPASVPMTRLLESGDFVWPKKPGAFVPYSRRAGSSRAEDRAIWEREKVAFLSDHRSLAPHLSEEQLSTLRRLEYRQFLTIYNGSTTTRDGAQPSRRFYLGHVGIIEITPDGEVFVIEAIDEGVTRTTYRNWLASRPGEIVWLGRLKGVPKTDRAHISSEATKYVGRPYNFWSFDLNDDSTFYCSKLAWLAVFRSLKIAVDGNQSPKRWFWLSPKQLLYLPAVSRVHEPGAYTWA